MPKTKSRRDHNSSSGKDTKEARLEAAQYFVKGDRVRHRATGALGIFIGLHNGFALPETWVVFDSDTDSRIPISCNPLDLELAQKDCAEHRVLRELGMLADTQLSFLSPDELHIEPDEQASNGTPALVDKVAPEVAEEMADGSSDHINETGTATEKEEVRDMAGTVDDTPAAAVEVVEELTPEEEAERHRLELKVERAFFEAGLALRVLRQLRLYRSTHKTWSDYCQDRFGFNRHSANFKIAASMVVENLATFSNQNGSHENKQVLPTKETQVRPLTQLEPEEQLKVWQQAVEAAGGKVPTERIVKTEVLRHKGIVERLKEKNPPPPEFVKNDVVEIKALKHSPLKQFDGMWGVIEHVGSYSYTVRIGIARDVQQFKGEEMAVVDSEYIDDIRAVSQRIAALVKFELEPVEYAILEVLQRSTCFTPKQMVLLAFLEKQYGIG